MNSSIPPLYVKILLAAYRAAHVLARMMGDQYSGLVPLAVFNALCTLAGNDRVPAGIHRFRPALVSNCTVADRQFVKLIVTERELRNLYENTKHDSEEDTDEDADKSGSIKNLELAAENGVEWWMKGEHTTLTILHLKLPPAGFENPRDGVERELARRLTLVMHAQAADQIVDFHGTVAESLGVKDPTAVITARQLDAWLQISNGTICNTPARKGISAVGEIPGMKRLPVAQAVQDANRGSADRARQGAVNADRARIEAESARRRAAAEVAHKAEVARRTEEARQRTEEEARRREGAEAVRRAEEARRRTEKEAEVATRRAEETRQAEEARRVEEARVRAEADARRRAAEEAETAARQAEEARRSTEVAVEVENKAEAEPSPRAELEETIPPRDLSTGDEYGFRHPREQNTTATVERIVNDLWVVQCVTGKPVAYWMFELLVARYPRWSPRTSTQHKLGNLRQWFKHIERVGDFHPQSINVVYRGRYVSNRVHSDGWLDKIPPLTPKTARELLGLPAWTPPEAPEQEPIAPAEDKPAGIKPEEPAESQPRITADQARDFLARRPARLDTGTDLDDQHEMWENEVDALIRAAAARDGVQLEDGTQATPASPAMNRAEGSGSWTPEPVPESVPDPTPPEAPEPEPIPREALSSAEPAPAEIPEAEETIPPRRNPTLDIQKNATRTVAQIVEDLWTAQCVAGRHITKREFEHITAKYQWWSPNTISSVQMANLEYAGHVHRIRETWEITGIEVVYRGEYKLVQDRNISSDLKLFDIPPLTPKTARELLGLPAWVPVPVASTTPPPATPAPAPAPPETEPMEAHEETEELAVQPIGCAPPVETASQLDLLDRLETEVGSLCATLALVMASVERLQAQIAELRQKVDKT